MKLHQFKLKVEEFDAEGGVSVRVMPYGVSSERYDFWSDTSRHIQFDEGSLVMGDTVPLTVDHSPLVEGRIGVLAEAESRPDGLYASLRFAATQRAQDTRELLRIGAVDEVSAGVYLDESAEFTDDDGVVHMSGTVDHVAIVPRSQFGEAGAGSRVLAVHSKEGAPMETETKEAAPAQEPTIDYASASEVEELRATVAALSMPGVIKPHGQHDYRDLGEVLVDVNAHARKSDSGATERLVPFIDGGLVSADGQGVSLRLEEFAFPNPGSVGNSIGSGIAYNAYIPDLLGLLRQGRPTLDLVSKRNLPMEGNRVFMPAVSVGNIVDYQDGQGTLLASQRQDQILTDVPKATIGGGQGVTIQAQLWTNPNYMSSVAEDLVAAHSEFQNDKAVNGDPAVDTPASATGYTGIMEIAGTTDVPVGGAPAAIVPLLGTAWAAVWTGTRRAPTHALMSAAMWGALLNEVDTDGRPIIQNIAPSNPVGTGDAGSVAGTLRGLTVVIDDSVGDTDVIVTNFRDTILFEDSASPAQLRLTYPDVLVTDISIFSFSAFFIRRPAAYAILSGITIP